MMCPGSEYVGDKFLFIGPSDLPYTVHPGRIRLNAFGRQVYLGRIVEAVADAVRELAAEIEGGNIRSVDAPASDRGGSDRVMAGAIEVARLLNHSDRKAINDGETMGTHCE